MDVWPRNKLLGEIAERLSFAKLSIVMWKYWAARCVKDTKMAVVFPYIKRNYIVDTRIQK